MMFFGARRFGPLGLAYTAYRVWKRLSPAQKAALKQRGLSAMEALRGKSAMTAPATYDQESRTRPAPPSSTRSEQTTQASLTSPGTVADPELEQRRAEEALIREKESRESETTKFEELRLQQEAERHKLALSTDEPPPRTT